VSGHIASLLLDRIRLSWPALQDVRPGLGQAWARQAWARLAMVDLAAALIRFADAVETGFRYLWRALSGLRRLPVLLRLPGLRLTGGLVWRSVAAASGIGLTTALVTALSPGSEVTLASLTVQEAQPVRDVRHEPRASQRSRENWIPIIRPIPMFGLESPELDRASASLDARRSPDGSLREDVLAFSAFAEQKPHLLLRFSVEHGRSDLSQPFIIALVREAASRAMSVQRSGTPTAMQTRFGPVETADATLSDGEVSRACIAFRMDAGALPLSMSGWWCGAGKPADRQQLVCLIDRIDLLNAGDDRALRAAFARTELNRQPACAPPRLSASGRKLSWLDADAATPALRTKSITAEHGKPKPRR
jgi:hypothetical protein